MKIALAVVIAAAQVAAPAGYWSGPMRGDTPAEAPGAETIDLATLEQRIARNPPVLLIDASPAEARPPARRPAVAALASLGPR